MATSLLCRLRRSHGIALPVFRPTQSAWTTQKKNSAEERSPAAQFGPAPPIPPDGAVDATTVERPLPASTLASRRYTFPRLTRRSELAAILADDGTTLWYRSFVSVTALVATLVTAFVFLCGLAAVVYLFVDGRFGGALLSLLVTAGFGFVIPMLVPPADVVFFTDAALTARALEIAQIGRPLLPADRFAVRSADGHEIGRIERSALSRLTRHRWSIFDRDGRLRAVALEESTGRAMIRKLTGKFRSDLDSDLLLTIDGEAAGRLSRRASGERVTLQLTRVDRSIDQRLLVATAALVFGLEP